WFLPKAAHPYYVLSPQFPIDFSAPGGPNIPLDPGSVEVIPSFLYNDDKSNNVLKGPAVKSLLENAKSLKKSHFEDYQTTFYIDGHGPVIDLAKDEVNIELANKFYRTGKVNGVVCHGPAGFSYIIVRATEEDGTSIFDGKAATGFSNAEENRSGSLHTETFQDVPFLLEDRINSLCGKNEKADGLWGIRILPKVAHSGNLFTGQNPASAGQLAKVSLKT
ncbi:Class I glutamine amidotransferase-like protein, partial [Lactarius tabidus]